METTTGSMEAEKNWSNGVQWGQPAERQAETNWSNGEVGEHTPCESLTRSHKSPRLTIRTYICFRFFLVFQRLVLDLRYI